jgi:Protein of unknown function, DUF481
MKNGIRLLLPVITVILSLINVAAQDTLKLSNGDQLHGEIKSLNKSVLSIETDYSDADFKVEWKDVTEISSGRKFNIFLSSKEKIYTSFGVSAVPGMAILLPDGGGRREVKLDQIVIIDPIKDTFKDRFNASISAGFTLTKANNSKQFTSRATASYHTKSWHLSGNYNNTRSEQDNVEPIRRTDGSINFNYLFYKNWFASFSNDFLSNTEQQIDLRSTQTFAVGNLLVRNNKLYLSSSAGLTFNRENYANEADVINTTEGFLGAEFNAYDIGDLNFLTKLSYYPSITEKNRNRVNFSVDVKYDFPYDIFIKLGYTLNYDSQPPNEGANQDYVFQTTLGWEF